LQSLLGPCLGNPQEFQKTVLKESTEVFVCFAVFYESPKRYIFVWQDRFYGENVAEEEANCNKFLQKYLVLNTKYFDVFCV